MVSDLEAQANSKFVDEEFEEAAELYTKALNEDSGNAGLYLGRAAAHLKLENYTDAVADANKAIELDQSLSKAYLRKGIACFHLEEYQTARVAFQAGAALDPANSTLKTWIRKCEAEIEDEAGMEQKPGASPTQVSMDNGATVKEVAEAAPLPTAPPPPPAAETSATPAPTPKTPKFRHEWYQTSAEVAVTVFAKGVEKENLQVDFGEQMLSVVIALPDDDHYALQLRLFGKIVPEASRFIHMKTKIEVRLRKAESIQWTGLEYTARKTVDQPLNFSDARAEVAAAKYPSSSKRREVVNWDKLEAQVKSEEKDEKLEGDAALNKLFQDIYKNADEDTRRAMNKSFVESNGTVLSTNWKDIGSKKVVPHSSK